MTQEKERSHNPGEGRKADRGGTREGTIDKEGARLTKERGKVCPRVESKYHPLERGEKYDRIKDGQAYRAIEKYDQRERGPT